MNTQMRFTSVEAREARLTMQARLREAEAYRLTHPVPDMAEPRVTGLHHWRHALYRAEREAWALLAEVVLEAGDMLHGHRPHRHHAHQVAATHTRHFPR